MTISLVQSIDDKIVMPIGRQLGKTLNPHTIERTADFYNFTPLLARWMLDKHNEDNRPIVKGQVKAITGNIDDVGILYDGNPATINMKGNLTEKQHFFTWLSTQPEDTVIELLVTTGVDTDTFSRAAASLPRTYSSEIWRKYGEDVAPKAQIATLADLIKRSSCPNIKINNAVGYWNDWSHDIKQAFILTKSFRENVQKFNSFAKTISAWATFCVRYHFVEECKIVLKLMENEIRDANSITVLTSQALDVWNGAEKASTNGLSNDKRINILFGMFCRLNDRVAEYPLGDIEFTYNITELQSAKMGGCYRKFTS